MIELSMLVAIASYAHQAPPLKIMAIEGTNPVHYTLYYSRGAKMTLKILPIKLWRHS